MAWKVRSSRTGAVSSVTMPGSAYDLSFPAPGDYDGVHHAQRALFNRNGWFVEGHATPILFGNFDASTTIGHGVLYPAVADYDGDGKVDLSYVSTTGVWTTRSSANTAAITTFSIGEADQGPGYDTFPVEFPTSLLTEIARLTLLSRNCWPNGWNYPQDC
jgi:hypothetical protein